MSIPDRFSQNFFSLIPIAIFSLFFGPIPEEMGWCGYALGKLQGKFNPLAASLILGCVWFVWHIPLFFIPDSYQNSLVVNRQIPLWFFPVNINLQTIIMTYIFNQTCGSTLSAVILHFSVNFCGEVFAISRRGAYFQILLWAFAAAAICLHWSRTKNSDNRSPLS